MSSRIGYAPANYNLRCDENLEDFAFERQSNNFDPQSETAIDMDTSSTDSGSEHSSPSKPKNISQISPQKLPIGLNFNKQVTPIGSNPNIANMVRLSAFLQTAQNAYKENARDSFNKGVAALDEKKDEKATLYARRSNEYIEEWNCARQGIQKVQTRFFQGVEVVPTKKS